ATRRERPLTREGATAGIPRGIGPRMCALSCSIPAVGCRLLGLHEEARTAVLCPARLVVLLALRPILAIADDSDPTRIHAAGNEIVHRRLRPPVPERQVVLVRPALVAMALDEEHRAGARPEPGRVGIERFRRIRTDLVLVEVEVDVTQVGAWREVRHPRPRRRLRRRRPRRQTAA